MSLPNLPKPINLRRQQRRDGGYDMVPAYTTEEVVAWGNQVYGEALTAALVRIKATITCDGDTPDRMREAIALRVGDLSKAALKTLPPPAMRVEALPASDGKFVSINGHIHEVVGWESPNVLADNLRERLRASDDRYHALMEAIASGRALMPQPSLTLTVTPAIDYDALIGAAYDRHRYRQGTGTCIAFKHGAEWMRDQAINSGSSISSSAAPSPDGQASPRPSYRGAPPA